MSSNDDQLHGSGDLNELRRQALEEDIVVEAHQAGLVRDVVTDRVFGMTAVERMFVSIGCFLVTSLGGFLLLLVLEKIALP